PGTPPANPFPQPRPPQPQVKQQSDSNLDRVVAPRISPQPARLSFKPGEEKLWSVVGMDLDGLTAPLLALRYDPQSIEVSEVTFGPAVNIAPKTPPVVKINREIGKVTIAASDGKSLSFNGGGDIATLHIRGGGVGESYLVMENPTFTNIRGEVVVSEVAGGRAKVE